MTEATMTDLAQDCGCAAPAPRRPLSLGQRFRAALHLRRQRRALAEMDDRMLADMGLTRSQALNEAVRPIWDVPQNWRF
jgi:uncharacterized protein YjiS (DUF1127 family)